MHDLTLFKENISFHRNCTRKNEMELLNEENKELFHEILMDKGYICAQQYTNAYIPPKKDKEKSIE